MAASSVPRSPAHVAPTVIPALRRARSVVPYVGLATLSAVQAWEWLFSGLTKIQNGAFIRGFMGFVSGAPGPYGRLLKNVIGAFPAGLIPRLVEGTELALGSGLLAAAVLLLLPSPRFRRQAILVAGGASLVGAALAINIAIIAHDRAPWTLGMAPFSTGVPVEALLAGISLAGVAEAFSARRAAAAALLRRGLPPG